MFGRRNYISLIALTGLCFVSGASFAVRFEPGVGFGMEYTDNARLTADDQVDDVIAVAYVGARLDENEGALKYDAVATFNKQFYTQDSYTDQRYFNLSAGANWEMVKKRFFWILRDEFNQRTIVSLNSNTPDNLQNTNVLTFGANYIQPISARQQFTLTPMFKQYYYEVLATDNDQLSLAANWNYQMFRLTNVGITLSTRNIDYTEQAIEDTRFTNMGLLLDGTGKRWSYSMNLGSTNVKRNNGDESTGFSGYFNWLTDLTVRSQFKMNISTDLTDSSSASVASNIPDGGNGDDVQVTTDVIRNSIVNFDYIRDDAPFNSRFWFKYNKITYSDSPLNRVVRALGIQASYPLTRLLSSSVYANYNRTKQLDTERLDKRFTVGGNLKYNFSRKLHGLFDLKYRTKESTSVLENYDESSVFVNLVYGFGGASRPTRAGGF